MLERFINCKDQILNFATNFLVPFGNNIAEQAIRMMKVKQKISGCFRSEQGARDFADTRSYIATAKNKAYPSSKHSLLPFKDSLLNYQAE